MQKKKDIRDDEAKEIEQMKNKLNFTLTKRRIRFTEMLKNEHKRCPVGYDIYLMSDKPKCINMENNKIIEPIDGELTSHEEEELNKLKEFVEKHKNEF